jgi:hypothetical protein
MALSANAIACGAVVVAGAALFTTGLLAGHVRDLALIAPIRAQPAPAAAIRVAQASPAASTAPSPSTASAAGITLRSVSVDLPTGDRMFPGGAAADPINNNCLACHSAGMVLQQPALTRATWQDEVNKMRDFYKAPVANEDVPAIVDYLATNPGAK